MYSGKSYTCKNCGAKFSSLKNFFGEHDKNMVCSAKCAFEYRDKLKDLRLIE